MSFTCTYFAIAYAKNIIQLLSIMRFLLPDENTSGLRRACLVSFLTEHQTPHKTRETTRLCVLLLRKCLFSLSLFHSSSSSNDATLIFMARRSSWVDTYLVLFVYTRIYVYINGEKAHHVPEIGVSRVEK